MARASAGSMFSSSSSAHSIATRSPTPSSVSNSLLSSRFMGGSVRRKQINNTKAVKICRQVRAAAAGAVATSPLEEVKEYKLPSWAMFELGRAPVYWKTMNGLPPSSGEQVRLFYNPAATKLAPNEQYGIAFNGGFNQPIMCGGEPRVMLRKERGKADSPIYSIQICVPKHAINLIFSFTNGADWDGPYRLQFQVPKPWRNRPIDFFNEGLAEELNQEGACDRAIFPDSTTVVSSCAMIGNLTVDGGDRCELNIETGCMDMGSPMYNPLAIIDDGSCPPYSDLETNG